MTDKLAGMAMFVRVAELGSFAAAAEASGVSLAMAAKHIRTIEQRLGARLLHRTTRRQRLTEVGRLYYERSKTALAEIELAEASASELQSTPHGRLRLVAPVSFGTQTLVPALVEYMQRNCHVSVDLALDNDPHDLIGEGYELGIHIGHIGELKDTDLVARPLRPYRRILAASPDYLARFGEPLTPEDLAEHQCLGHTYWQTQGRRHLVGPQDQTCEIVTKGSFTANQGQALYVAALHGAGIVLQPELLLEAELACGALVPALPEWSYKPTPMYLVYTPDRRPTAMLRSAIDFLISRFG